MFFHLSRSTHPGTNLVWEALEKDALEAVAKLGAHNVVEDWVDGRVDVEHEAGEVEQVEVSLLVYHVENLVGADDDPQGEDLRKYSVN